MNKKKTKVLMVAAEASPLAKVGGLADVVGSLPIALNKLDCEARVIIPKYRNILEKEFSLKKVASDILVKIGKRSLKVNLWQTKNAIKDTIVYLIEDNKYFIEKSVYEQNKPEDFLFFCQAVLTSLPHLKFKPDIIHCHDFHTGAISALLKTDQFPGQKNIKTLFTIHNLRFQGKSDPKILKLINLDEDSLVSMVRDAEDGDINLMVQAIINSDLVNTVSPTYSQEISSKKYAAGLEKIIKANRKKISGILNGIDIVSFNPETDRTIKENYSLKTINKKKTNKLWLQKKLGLEEDEKIPLVCFIGRLYSQKGIYLINDEIINLPCQFVFLGTGDQGRESYLKKMAKKYPKKVSANIMFNLNLARQIYAGSDMILVPSLFEPCGLIQMISMRYGTIPVVRDTGGLSDTINPKLGFKFKNFSTPSLKNTLKKALNLYYKNPNKWLKLQKNCLKKDFSWGLSAKKYLTLYKKLAIKK